MKPKQFKEFGLFVCFAIFLIACDKPKAKIPAEEPTVTTEMANGFPDNKEKIHGYFYAANTLFSTLNRSRYLYAVFGDPARDLMQNFNHVANTTRNGGQQNSGNVNVGAVSFNDYQINPSGLAAYYSNNSVSVLDVSTKWRTDGNGSFKPVDLNVPRGFPTVNVTGSYSLSLSKEFKVDVSGIFGNYDSLAVIVSRVSSYFSPYNSVSKTISASDPSLVTFKPAEMATALTNTGYGSIIFSGFNYSHKTAEDHVYVFELSTQTALTLTISP